MLTGALALSLLDTMFLQLALPTFMVDLARASVLLLVILVELRGTNRFFRRYGARG
jgi:hypothetical protein